MRVLLQIEIDFNKMTKRVPQQDISDLDNEVRKVIKDVNSEAVKVAPTTLEKSELSYFIKNKKMIEILNGKGIEKFFPIQYETFDTIYRGEDLIARDRTGSGKTLAFALPIIERFREQGAFEDDRRVKFLIVLPTRELCIQVKTEIKSLRLRGSDFEAVAVYGGSDVHEQIRKIRDGVDIIVSTPGRLIDLLERGVIRLSSLQVTCLDQADQMLKQGFQEDIEKIFQYVERHAPKKTQNLLFSATIPSWVIDLSKKYLSKDRKYVDLIRDTGVKTSKTVQHLALNCPYSHRNAIIADLVNLYGGRHGRTIIFCETKREANQVTFKANLKQETQVLHGDIPQKQREVTFASFKEGKLKVLVATNVAARGLDIPEVDLILQLEPPKEIDSYIHRSGRTGRAGRSGVCVTFYTRQQQSLIERIERVAKIRFKKIGAPQPIDIVRSSARDIVISLKQVKDGVLTHFNDIAQEMIQEEGAVKALSKALAYISGNTQKISQRSLLCSIDGYITYIVRCPNEYRSPGYIFNFLRMNTSDRLAESVKGMRRHSKTSAVFDVAEEFKEQMDKLIEEAKQQKLMPLKGFEVLLVDSVEMLEDAEEENQRRNQFVEEEFDERQVREARRNKRDWEIFIGSLPSNCEERELAMYFKEKGIKITDIRILRNEQGESKCVGFGLCLDEDNFRRAQRLDGDRFGTKMLRINRASR